MPRPNLTEENRVIVRYWPGSLSSVNANSTGSWVSFGHVALQTFVGGRNNRGYYISFWRADIDRRCCGKNEDHIHDREEDVRYCGQAHIDYTFTLYSLDAKAINAAYEIIMQRGLRWQLSGSLFYRQDEHVAVCSSLIYRLLMAGGFNRLVNKNERIFLGLGGTAQTTLIRGALGFGAISSFLRNIILNIGYIKLEIQWININEKHKLVHHFFHWGLRPPLEHPLVKQIIDDRNLYHSLYFFSPFETVRKLVSNAQEELGPVWCSISLTAVITIILVVLLTSQRATANYLIVKPADFPLLMQRAINAEQRLSRSNVRFFDHQVTSIESDPTSQLEPTHNSTHVHP